jgi:hypothetical protein
MLPALQGYNLDLQDLPLHHHRHLFHCHSLLVGLLLQLSSPLHLDILLL